MLRSSSSGIQYSGGGIGLKASGVLAQSAVPASVTGTLTETVLATIPIPAGAMGVNGGVRIYAYWSATNNANAKTVSFRLGGTLVAATGSIANNLSMCNFQEIRNRGAFNQQMVRQNPSGPFGAATGAIVNIAVDTSQTQNLTLTATLANAADTITLEGYTVEILNP